MLPLAFIWDFNALIMLWVFMNVLEACMCLHATIKKELAISK